MHDTIIHTLMVGDFAPSLSGQDASSWLMSRCHTNIYTSIYTIANTSTKVYKHHYHPHIDRTTVLSDTNQLTKIIQAHKMNYKKTSSSL